MADMNSTPNFESDDEQSAEQYAEFAEVPEPSATEGEPVDDGAQAAGEDTADDELAVDQGAATVEQGAGEGISADDDGEPEISEADQALLKVAELEEQLARRNADLYNLRQEYNGFVKRSKQENMNARESGVNKVLEALMGVLDDAALARQHDDLTGPAGTIIDKLEATLKINFGLERFGAEGEDFDPNFHEALMSSTSPDVESEQIAQLIQPGYKVGDRVIRPARVGVVAPE